MNRSLKGQDPAVQAISTGAVSRTGRSLLKRRPVHRDSEPHCGNGVECRRNTGSLQRASSVPHRLNNAGEVPQAVQDVMRSSGLPLDPEVRSVMEPRFGCDFGRVRVHTDARAADAAQAINARAYTLGNHLVFAPGQYAPRTEGGKRLLAHELAHTIQQAGIVAREAEIIPAPPLDLGGPASERARTYQPRLRPHVPRAPTIPAPPLPPEVTAPPGPCPPRAQAIAELRANSVANRTEAEMRRDVNIAAARSAGGATPVTRSMIRRADRAIRSEFGSVLPAGRGFTSPGSVTMHSPAAFVQLRVPDAATARRRIGRVALEVSEDLLRRLCIRNPDDASLQSEVTAPLFSRLGIDFVRRHEAGRIGGQTAFGASTGRVTPRVDIPSESRFMGHILVHEAMHFYVHDDYRRIARTSRIERHLMEGGAEFLARRVINQRLAGVPAFRIRTGTYSSEFSYVANYLMRGGLSSFKLAYFQGRTDLLGLPSAQPKLAISAPGDALEQEADRIAESVLMFHPEEDSSGGEIPATGVAPGGERHKLSPAGLGQILMRDLAQEPPSDVPQQRELTPERVGRAIAYNRASYTEESTRLIQDLVGAAQTGRFDELTVRLVALIQRRFGLVPADGKVGPDTYDFLIRELRAEGVTPGTCLTMFQLVGPRPVRFFRTSPTQGMIGSGFEIRARFDPRCNCSDFHYRQHVSGHVELLETARTGVAPPARSGCAILAATLPRIWVWNMDGCFHIPGGGLTRRWREDGDSRIPAGTSGHHYGHRSYRANPTDGRDRYLPNRATGCIYEGRDNPMLTPVPATSADSGEIYDWEMRFRGRIVRTDGTVVAEKWWSVMNLVNIP